MVIGIIAVLPAILMPAMRKIKEIARETVCRSNLKNVGLAVAMYLDAFGLNSHPRARHRNTNDVYRLSEFIFCTDHAEPRPECGTSDGFHNGDVPGAMNLRAIEKVSAAVVGTTIGTFSDII